MKKFWDIFLIILVGILILSYYFFHVQISIYLFPSNNDRVGELTKLLLSILGGIGIFYGLIISNIRALITEKSVIKQGEQLELSRKSQIDERFKNAIEHLGNDKEPIILGGVAELYQIAKEDKHKYSEVVFNILNSYIRSETSIYNKTANDFNSTVIRTIITYLFKIDSINPFIGLEADLSSSNLACQNIEFCNFENADLSFAIIGSMKNCILDAANLSNANVQNSFFKDNSMRGIEVFSAVFRFIEFKNTIFKNKYFSEDNEEIFSATFINCKFINVSFDDIYIYNTVFICCIFNNCSFHGTTIIECKFLVSNLSNITFGGTKNLAKCNFSGNVFNNINFNCIVIHVAFKGCRIGDIDDIYINIEKYLKESLKNIVNFELRDLLLINNIDCKFDKFTEDDYKEIDSLFKTLCESKKLPLSGTN